MTRTFTILATLLAILLVSSYGVGWWNFAHPKGTPEHNDLFFVHFYLGLGTAIVGLLVHCLIFTYFLGTGRWVKEVGIAYRQMGRLNNEDLPKITRELKRIVFPPALYAMLICIATAAAGAGAQLQAWPWQVHATLATLTLIINFWAFRVEYYCLTENARVLNAVLDEVDKIRASEGLLSNAEALAEQNDGAR